MYVRRKGRLKKIFFFLPLLWRNNRPSCLFRHSLLHPKFIRHVRKLLSIGKKKLANNLNIKNSNLTLAKCGASHCACSMLTNPNDICMIHYATSQSFKNYDMKTINCNFIFSKCLSALGNDLEKNELTM